MISLWIKLLILILHSCLSSRTLLNSWNYKQISTNDLTTCLKLTSTKHFDPVISILSQWEDYDDETEIKSPKYAIDIKLKHEEYFVEMMERFIAQHEKNLWRNDDTKYFIIVATYTYSRMNYNFTLDYPTSHEIYSFTLMWELSYG